MTVGKLSVGDSVKDILQRDLKLEHQAIKDLTDAIADCDKHKDFASQSVFQQILDQEDPHIEWLESQLGLIEKLGLENYLQSQI